MRALSFLILFTACGAAIAQASAPEGSARSPFWNDNRRGWHFYEDPELSIEPIKPTVKAPAAPASQPKPEVRPPEIVEFEQLQKRLEEYRNVAIMRPTEQNVRRYLELEASVVNRATYFSDVAQRVAWASPDLDVTAQGRPTNYKALQVYDEEKRSSRTDNLTALAADHVLLFFFRSDCKYCHALAPTLEAFSRKHGLKIMPVSMDGGPIPGFKDYKVDNGIAKKLGVQSVPATFLAKPFTGDITTIGFGVLSEGELIERITTVTSPGSEAMTPSVSRKVALQ